MTRRVNLLLGGVAVVVVGLFVTTRVVSQDQHAESATGAEWAEAMAKWAALNAKGPEHERFAEMAGKENLAECRATLRPVHHGY